MRKQLASVVLLCLWFLLLTGVGLAQQQVILGQSTTGNILFTNTGPNSANFMFTGTCGANPQCLSGYGYYGANVGTYDMWIVGAPLTLGSPTGGVFPINMGSSTINFTYDFTGNYLDGTIVLQNLTDGTQSPRFVGYLDITASTLAGFTVGDRAYMDFTGYLGYNPTVDEVYSGSAASTSGILSSGELAPVPEPGTMVLFGTGLAGLVGFARRRMNL
jgi:PEP-CTERM motif